MAWSHLEDYHYNVRVNEVAAEIADESAANATRSLRSALQSQAVRIVDRDRQRASITFIQGCTTLPESPALHLVEDR